jgi:hypothetical protein
MLPTPPKNPNIAPQQNQDNAAVMDAIKKEQGESGEQKAADIILRDAALAEGADPEEFFFKLASMVKNAGAKLVQINNSVFLVIPKQQGVVETHIATQESPKGIARAYSGLAKTLKNQGVQKAYTYSDNPAFQSVAKLTGLNVKISQDAKYIGGQMKPSYIYELEL